jgi:signal transduction histidine kinase
VTAERTATGRDRLAFLEIVNRMLDGLVKRRTLDLVSTNRRLLEEIATRKETERELERSRDELRSLAEHLQRAQEEERIRIARELHDQVGQVLSALKIDVSCLLAPPVDAEILGKRTVEMSRHLDAAIRCVRTACADLRAPVLEDFGLAAAITYHLRGIKERTGLRCTARLDAAMPPLDRALSLVLYRVFQEAVSNVVRHAHARSIRVRLECDGKLVTLSVRDDGRGFGAKTGSRTVSFGILGMRERVRFWGGHWALRSVAGKGTTVLVQVPVTGANEGKRSASVAPRPQVGRQRRAKRRAR